MTVGKVHDVTVNPWPDLLTRYGFIETRHLDGFWSVPLLVVACSGMMVTTPAKRSFTSDDAERALADYLNNQRSQQCLGDEDARNDK